MTDSDPDPGPGSDPDSNPAADADRVGRPAADGAGGAGSPGGAGGADGAGGVDPGFGTDPAAGIEDRATFEDVDWASIDLDRSRRSPRLLAGYAVAALYLLAAAYDLRSRYLVGAGPAEFPLIGPVDGVTWLYVPTLFALAYYVAVPLFDEPRMARYYWREFRKNTAAVISLGWLAVVFVVGTVGSRVLPQPAVEPLLQYQPPAFATVDAATPIQCVGREAGGTCHGSWAHPLGTTGQGKDVFVSVVHGMEISMQVGLIGTFLIVMIASAVGLSAAYFGGWTDEILMRYVDIQITFPTFFLYLLVVFLFDATLFSMIIIFGVFGWGGIARIVRSEALQRREEQYVRAAHNAGASGRWIMRRHLLPNVSNSVITAATLTIPSLILFEAALAFLNLGDPSISSWGELIAAGRGDLDRAWWVSTIPGVFLFFTILAFNFIGDALRDALDPRQEAGE